MTDLIAVLSTGKGTWAQLYQLIEKGGFNKIYLITNQFGKEKFNNKENTELIVVDMDKPLKLLSEEMTAALRPLFAESQFGEQIALNFVSGTGKEHMALISALISLGIGFRIVHFDNQLEVF